LSNPDGLDPAGRRRMLDCLRELHTMRLEESADPALETRIAQYELAFRMQRSIPEVIDMSSEPKSVLDAYGKDAANPGTYAANCLLARRLAERGVRFIQLFHQGWDQHGNLAAAIAGQCRETDQASAALVADLKRRGLLDETLVIWGGEFGRTNYCQGKLTKNDFGRDHHPACFSIWMAGGGVRPGVQYGRTDDYGYNAVENPVHIHDLQATILHLLGIDHERLTFKHQGRRFRLTDVAGKVVRGVVS
jgi:arylsulfatase A-like enzyme